MQIFRTGTHIDAHGREVTITEADLAATATAYDPSLHEAPLVVGHPQTNAPAYGWVQTLQADRSSLNAIPHQLDANFSELVKAGRFKKISASFYLPDHTSNPVPGVYYLRHVGFLGAVPPAIKGLKPIEFADGSDGVVELELEFQEQFQEPMTTNKEAELTAREKAIAAREAAVDRAEFANFAQGLLNQGKQFASALATEIYLGLPNEGTVSFAEGGQTKQATPREAFKQFLNSLPKVVEFGEVAAAGAAAVVTEDPIELARMATEFKEAEAAKGRTVSFTEAVNHVSGRAKR